MSWPLQARSRSGKLSASRHGFLQALKLSYDAEAAEELLERASSSSSSTPDVSNGTGAARLDGKAFRRALGKNGKYIRQPKNDPDSLALMDTHGVGYSTTGLVAQMRANGNRWQHKDVRVKLAQVCHP